jgi:hypothetical protein
MTQNVNVNPFGGESRRGGAHIVVMNAGAVIFFLLRPAGSILVSAFLII